MEILRTQNHILTNHPNSNIYKYDNNCLDRHRSDEQIMMAGRWDVIHSPWFCFLLCSTLSGLVEFDGFFLESDPCLVCNNPEVPFSVSAAAWFRTPRVSSQGGGGLWLGTVQGLWVAFALKVHLF